MNSQKISETDQSEFPKYILRVANNNVTILSSTHCSAPSAWPFIGNIIGFSRFWRKLVIFCTRNIYQNERPFIKNTYVFEPSFSDIYFTGWFDFSFIFSVFSGLTAFISGIWYFFCFFIFLFNTPWSSEYTWVDFILVQAFYWLIFNKRL